MYYILVFLGVAYEQLLERFASLHGKAMLSVPAFKAPKNVPPAALCALSLAGLFALRLALIAGAAHEPGAPSFYAHLPLPTIYDSPAMWTLAHRRNTSIALALIAAASSLALFFLHRSLAARGTKRDYAVVAGSAALMATQAFFFPAFSSSDPYLYAAYGELGLQAYADHPLQAPCPDPQPDAWCKRTVIPSLYGPLCLTYFHALLGQTGSIQARLAALRLANIGWVAILLFALQRLGVGAPLLALAALSPVLWGEYVGDGHNDVIGLALLLLAMNLAKRYPLAALLCSVAACLIKLPFALLGLLVFLPLPLLPRLAWGSATFICSIATTLLWGGHAYTQSLLTFMHNPRFTNFDFRFVNTLAALALIALALLKRNIRLSGAYAIPALGEPAAHSWYTWWALPYIVRNRSKLSIFLIVLPMSSFLVETPFQLSALVTTLVCLLTALIFITMLRASRHAK